MPDKNPFMAREVVAQAASPGKPKKLLEQVRDLVRLKHYSLRTERSYCDWIERFIRFHGKRHPRDLGDALRYPSHHRLRLKRNGLSLPSRFRSRSTLRR